MLYEGKWEASDGRIFKIPALTRDNQNEQALVKTANAQACELGLHVVKVWAVYLSERIVYQASQNEL